MIKSQRSTSIQLQVRDLSILRGLFESRLMTAVHIAAIYFAGSREAAKKRIQKLKSAHLVSERKRRVNEACVLFLTRKGYSLLLAEKLIADLPKLSPAVFEKRAAVSDLTIRHELEVMDVKAAFHMAVPQSKALKIGEFSTWPRLHEFKAMRPEYAAGEVLVKPDGFIRIEEEENEGASEHAFFLEVDRSTETQTTLVNRTLLYLNYYKSGGFAAAQGATRSEYKKYPFRVLIVVKNSDRQKNTAARLLSANPPILTFVYLTTYAEVTTTPLGSIWLRPVDYQTGGGKIELIGSF